MPDTSRTAEAEGHGKLKLFSTLERVVVIAIIGLFYVLVAVLSQKRGFDPDEFLHLHSAWSIYKGLLPFRDYFDHYTPLYHLFLVPFFAFFRVDSRPADAISFLLLARGLAWFTSGIVLFLTFRLGKLWGNTQTGLAAVLFLIIPEAYWNVTLEARPDTMSVVFWLLCLIVVVRTVRGSGNEQSRRKKFFLSGVLLAVGFLTIQKIVYAFPGLALGMAWYAWQDSFRGTRKERVYHVVCQFSGFTLPILLTFGYFFMQHSLGQFFSYNFLFYLGVPKILPYVPIQTFLYQHPFLGLMGVAGLISSGAAIWKNSDPGHGDFIIAPVTASLVGGLFIIPTPLYQYFIFFMPLLAILAARFLLKSVDWFMTLRDRVSGQYWVFNAALSVLAVMAAIAWITVGAGSRWSPFLILGYWLGVLAVGLTLVYVRIPPAALIVFFVALAVGPMIRLGIALKSSAPDLRLSQMRYINENSEPTDTVMDGYQGSGVFRPHAFFFWFLSRNERTGVTESMKQQLLQDMRRGVVAPRFILLDADLRSVSPGITEFFEMNYESTGIGVLWKRKTVQVSLPN